MKYFFSNIVYFLIINLACDPNLHLYQTQHGAHQQRTLLEFVVRKTPEMWFAVTLALAVGWMLGPLRRQTVSCCGRGCGGSGDGVRIGRRFDLALSGALLLLLWVWWYTGELTLINPLGCVLYRDSDVVQQPLQLGNLTQRVVGDAQHFIRDAAIEKGVPFFLYLPFVKVHTALFVNEEFKGQSKNGFYGDNVEEMDWAVGEIMRTVRNVGVEKNTLTFFSSDNGPFLERGMEGGSSEPLRGAKGQNWEGGIRMPGIIHWPGRIHSKTKIPFAVSTMDILPTSLSIIDATTDKNTVIRQQLDGKDLSLHIPGLWRRRRSSSKSGGSNDDGILQTTTPHEWLFHYCGVDVHSMRYQGQYKIHYYTAVTEEDAWEKGGRPGSCPSDSICGCRGRNVRKEEPPLVFDVLNDPEEIV